jgi:ribonuclease HI
MLLPPNIPTWLWSPPPEDMVKINCDGGFRVQDMTGSTSAVIRQSDGSFVGAAASWLPSVASALVAEAEACRAGLRLALNMPELSRMILETDSLQLVSLWNSRRHQRLDIAVILKERDEMVSSLTSFCFVHVKRSTNSAAHLCARQVSPSSPSFMWHDQPSSFLFSSLQSDCNQSYE